MPFTSEEYHLCVVPVIDRAKREILADIRAGIVPPTVATFSELHDYVDANGYGGAFETDVEMMGDDETCAFWNAVQHGVDAWLRSGRPE